MALAAKLKLGKLALTTYYKIYILVVQSNQL